MKSNEKATQEGQQQIFKLDFSGVVVCVFIICKYYAHDREIYSQFTNVPPFVCLCITKYSLCAFHQ